MTQNIEFLGKYTLVGDSQAGKSSLCMMYTNNEFSPTTSTVGMDLFVKIVELNGQKYRLQIWDTAGQETYGSLRGSYYKGATCILYCFDLSDKKTFNNLEKWIEESKNQIPDNIIKCMVGTKCDLEYDRQVTNDEINNFMDKYNMVYFKTSSKHNKGITELFNFLNNCVIQKKISNKDPGLLIKDKYDKRKKCCN